MKCAGYGSLFLLVVCSYLQPALMQHRSFIGNNMFQCANVTACKFLVTKYFISNLMHFLKTRNKKTTVGIIMDRNYTETQGQMGGNTAGFDHWGRGGICLKCDQNFEVCLFNVYSSIMLYV
uniref:Secreted protein n=1 Tax=Rhipicephalus appendiculatus TaxID=34631 RepID=A0A131YIS3_RHIAP